MLKKNFGDNINDDLKKNNTIKNIQEDLKKKILVLDGATGTAIQKYDLSEADFRGQLFINNKKNLRGCNEVLNLTRPDIIKEIHQKYLEAGADIIETNSFNGSKFALKDYEIENFAYELSKTSAELASGVAREFEIKTNKKIYVAGSIGPTNKSCSLPSGENPFERDIDFDMALEAYKEQIRGLIDGKVDIILIETIFDGLNAKAALLAIEELVAEKNIQPIQIMISATVDKSGKILSGQSIESLITALDRDEIISYGFNCSFGAKDLVPLILRLEKITSKNISLHPNAGLPNEKEEYDETAEVMLEFLKPLINEQKINIIGGCCGTSYEHIKLISDYVKEKSPRILSETESKNIISKDFFLSGNEVLTKKDFYIVGERNNVAGSKLFKRLIEEQDYNRAIEISRSQVDAGANIIDVNLDDGFLESHHEMEKFLRVLQNDPKTSKFPVMVDSSDFFTIETALKNISGKAIVNSISLKEGEEKFLQKAKIIKKYGAAFVVMAFDESGQGVTFERKTEICTRAFNILIKNGFRASDIVFDPNILSIGTGTNEDRFNGINFIRATEYLRKNFPECGVIGGVSNVSFSFRGNNPLRAAIHKIFLDMGKSVGLNMAIINPQEESPKISEKEYNLIKNLIDGKENSLDEIFNISFISEKKIQQENKKELSIVERVEEALINGSSTTFTDDINELIKNYEPLDIIQNILMKGMEKVGALFEKGELYLPQIIRSASVMEKAIAILMPLIQKKGSLSKRGKGLMATVEGDVHDIGKNIVGTVLKCNGFQMIDLGIMTPAEKILEVALEEKVDVVMLSGLITPSLREMEKVIKLFAENELSKNIPILVGGAATSKLHTAVKLKNLNSGKIFYCSDASSTVPMVSEICSENKIKFLEEQTKDLEKLEQIYLSNKSKKETQNFLPTNLYEKEEIIIPKILGKNSLKIKFEDIKKLNLIDYNILLHTLKVKNTQEEKNVLEEIHKVFDDMSKSNYIINCAYGIFPCEKNGDEIIVISDNQKFSIPLCRGETKKDVTSLADFFSQKDYIGIFVVSVQGNLSEEKDEYKKILENLISTRVAEAGAEYLHRYVSENNFKVDIRPAVGYPSLPDHKIMKTLFDIVDGYSTGATLTKTFAINPLGSVCGIYISNPKAFYFDIKKDIEK
ncbi:MAG: methionine synthase [Fusobacteriaceae bacterium]